MSASVMCSRQTLSMLDGCYDSMFDRLRCLRGSKEGSAAGADQLH